MIKTCLFKNFLPGISPLKCQKKCQKIDQCVKMSESECWMSENSHDLGILKCLSKHFLAFLHLFGQFSVIFSHSSRILPLKCQKNPLMWVNQIVWANIFWHLNTFYGEFSVIFLLWSSNFRSFFHFDQVFFWHYFTLPKRNFLTFLPTSRILS